MKPTPEAVAPQPITCEAGHRPLLLVGNDRNRQRLAARDDVWTFAPLPAVLPRCRAIVHAGGHGSTAAALHAGVPQLALPMAFDQLGHGQRIARLGVGAVLPFRRVGHGPHLRDALDRTLAPARAETAATMARSLRDEDGPEDAAEHLEQVLSRPGCGD